MPGQPASSRPAVPGPLVPALSTTAFVSNFFAWPDASTTLIALYFQIPDDWDGSAVTVNFLRRGAAAGTAVMRRTSIRFRDATAFSTIETNTAMNFTPGDTNSHLVTFTLAASNFAVGDTVRVQLERVGGDAGDTMAATVDFDACWVEF